mmetsp:Transcript_841/g.1781  ORF Transcript_841/g.1781 Transcript_841/m.1781 type:complete len:263 (+) Transcript_841:38-826(+)
MGSGESKLRDDAGLVDKSMTVDCSEPSSSQSSFSVSRQHTANDREYEMKAKDSSDSTTLSSKIFDDLTLGFDILSSNRTITPGIYASAVTDDGLDDDGSPVVVARVAADESHRKWTVYWLTPTYPSQAEDPEASKASGVKLYKRMQIQVSEGRYSAIVTPYQTHSSPKEDTGVLATEPILKLEKPIGLSELLTTHYYTLLPGEEKESSSPIAAWKWSSPFAKSMDFHITKGADLTLHFILLVIMNLVHRDQVFGLTQQGDLV